MPGTTIPLPKPLPRLWVTLTARPLESIAARCVVDAPPPRPLPPATATGRRGASRRARISARSASVRAGLRSRSIGTATTSGSPMWRWVSRRAARAASAMTARWSGPEVLEGAHVPAGHPVERLDDLRAARRRRRREDLDVPVGRRDRVVPPEPLRVRLEVAPGHDTAQRPHDSVAEAPAVDGLDALAADPPERGGEVRLGERRADGRCAAAVEIGADGFRVEVGEMLVEHLAVERGQRRAGLGQLGGGLEHVAERQRAVIGENPRPPGEVAGDGHRQRPARVVGAVEPLAGRAGRRAARGS